MNSPLGIAVMFQETSVKFFHLNVKLSGSSDVTEVEEFTWWRTSSSIAQWDITFITIERPAGFISNQILKSLLAITVARYLVNLFEFTTEWYQLCGEHWNELFGILPSANVIVNSVEEVFSADSEIFQVAFVGMAGAVTQSGVHFPWTGTGWCVGWLDTGCVDEWCGCGWFFGWFRWVWLGVVAIVQGGCGHWWWRSRDNISRMVGRTSVITEQRMTHSDQKSLEMNSPFSVTMMFQKFSIQCFHFDLELTSSGNIAEIKKFTWWCTSDWFAEGNISFVVCQTSCFVSEKILDCLRAVSSTFAI